MSLCLGKTNYGCYLQLIIDASLKQPIVDLLTTRSKDAFNNRKT